MIEHGLLDLKNIINEEKKRPKVDASHANYLQVEQEIFNMMKPFARFLSKKDYDLLMNGMLKEVKLRERISRLQRYRKNGVRTLEEVERLDKEGGRKEEDRWDD